MLPGNREVTDFPDALYSAEQTRALDSAAIAAGTSGFELMQRAGEAAFTLLQCRWSDCSLIEVFCGAGNNGGDGYIVAALAADAGVPVRVWALTDMLKGDALRARELASARDVAINAWSGEEPKEGAVIVDALLGTGLRDAPRALYSDAIRAINLSAAPVLAIDIPSGLSADTGCAPGEVVFAAATISFIGLNIGLFTGTAADCCGELVYNDLGVERQVFASEPALAKRLSYAALCSMLAPRKRSAHKGDFGHVLVVGGDYGMAGAALLASHAAGRSGAGLVSCASRPEHLAVIVGRCPEVMARGVNAVAELEPLLRRASVVTIGPGLGQGEWAQSLLIRVLNSGVPVVIDADALNLVAAHALDLQSTKGLRVITPHPGEAARLLNDSVENIQQDRIASARKLARQYGATVLLKGPGSVIVDGEQVYINSGGNPGMASGGMGDVLSGVIAAMLAQGHDSADAVCLAAVVHARAADLAALNGERGMLASDVITFLPAVLNPNAVVSQ